MSASSADSPSSDPSDPHPGSAEPGGNTPAPRQVRSEELLRGDRELLILHHDDTYRLRLTRNGKLILHK